MYVLHILSDNTCQTQWQKDRQTHWILR